MSKFGQVNRRVDSSASQVGNSKLLERLRYATTYYVKRRN
jgi:hypothetical protein